VRSLEAAGETADTWERSDHGGTPCFRNLGASLDYLSIVTSTFADEYCS
jgi:hypothetical protein